MTSVFLVATVRLQIQSHMTLSEEPGTTHRGLEHRCFERLALAESIGENQAEGASDADASENPDQHGLL
jgi:hypothetical protein